MRTCLEWRVILTQLGYVPLRDLAEHPLWVHPTVSIDILLNRATNDARKVLALSVAVARRRFDEETSIAAGGAAVVHWFDASPRARAFASLRPERGITSGDLAVALMATMPPTPLSPLSGRPVKHAEWEIERARAIAATARLNAVVEPHGCLAAPWSYMWSTWLLLERDAAITTQHLWNAIDDDALYVLCQYAADAEALSKAECCGRERDLQPSYPAAFPCWRVPAVPVDEPPSQFDHAWTLRTWVASWPAREHDLGMVVSLEAMLASGTVASEPASAVSQNRHPWWWIAESTLRASLGLPSEPALSLTEGVPVWTEPRVLAFEEHVDRWRRALRAIAANRTLPDSCVSLVESLGLSNIHALLMLRDHVADARSKCARIMLSAEDPA